MGNASGGFKRMWRRLCASFRSRTTRLNLSGQTAVYFELSTAHARYAYNIVHHFRGLAERRLYALLGALMPPIRYGFSLAEETDLEFLPGRLAPNRQAILVTDRVVKDAEVVQWKQVLRIRYDYFERILAKAHLSPVLPFGAHPVQVRQMNRANVTHSRERLRLGSVLFAGAVHREWYGGTLIRELYGLKNRLDTIEALRSHFGADRLHDASSFEETIELLEAGDLRGKIVLFEQSERRSARIPADRWLEMVACFDYLICPPGGVIPLCHNLIEALAVGTIPICPYGAMLDPQLTENEVVEYDSIDRLFGQLEICLEQNSNEITERRGRGTAYHDNFLIPVYQQERFARLLQSPTSEWVVATEHEAVESWKMHMNAIPSARG